MTALEVWPTRAQLRPGEPLEVELRTIPGEIVTVEVFELGVLVATTRTPIDADGEGRTTIALPGEGRRAGYGIRASAGDGHAATSAIDVAAHWSEAPRYGAYCDFAPDEAIEESTRRADELLRLHVNVVQYYDWMASHHTFRAPTEEFIDPLGRRLSHGVARRKIALAHDRGMAAIAYGALYGAEAEFALQHPDWLLYDGRREPLALAEIFYLQDFSKESSWRSWILGQYHDAQMSFGFDGIHIDQYGYPKHALSRATGEWRDVDVAAEFPLFVEEASRQVRAQGPESGAIFNCVNAWPLERMTEVTSDAATYVEVWEPHTRYRDLYELIRRARVVRPDKAVILAAYLLPFHPDRARTAGALTTFRLASATIAASGGYHLVAVEGASLLTEAYYPRYGRLSAEEQEVVGRYADYLVRNTVLLHGLGATDVAWTHVGPTNDVITLSATGLGAYGAGAVADTLWVTGREAEDLTVLHLVNLRGVEDAWNVEQREMPVPIEDLEVRVRVTGGVAGAWWDTPDDDLGVARELAFTIDESDAGRFLVLRLPRIEVFASVWWRTASPTGE